mgnify:CR=1 FL=1
MPPTVHFLELATSNFAKRINGTVNSETVIDIKDDKKTTRTMISYKVDNTSIRKHVKSEKGHFTMNGRHYTYVRLEMKRDTFDQLIEQVCVLVIRLILTLMGFLMVDDSGVVVIKKIRHLDRIESHILNANIRDGKPDSYVLLLPTFRIPNINSR